MTTPATGQISLSQIRNEMDLSGESQLSDFYDAFPGVPISAAIKISDFYDCERHFIGSDDTNFNLRTEIGNPTSARKVLAILDTGATLSATNNTTPAFDTGSGWNASAQLRLINDGNIKGRGGNGGEGNQPLDDHPTVGFDAINLQKDLEVDNDNGNVFGGGGGGGGGGYDSGFTVIGSGGGGGGGAGVAPGGAAGINGVCPVTNISPTAGAAGTIGGGNAAGGTRGTCDAGGGPLIGGDGGDGGDWGETGEDGDEAIVFGSFQGPPDDGAVGGKAVDLNGNTITWIAGNNPAQVKGAQT